MADQKKPWYLQPLARWSVLRHVPMRRLWVLLLAGFVLFSVSGFYSDLQAKGTKPYAVVFLIAIYSGLNACLWILVSSRLPVLFVFPLIALQFFNTRIVNGLTHLLRSRFVLNPVASDTGIQFAATSMFWANIVAYALFIRYIVHEGKRSLSIQNELELAHGIQKTLVPALDIRTPHFHIFGSSHPSERVGGDLVDAVVLPGGDIVAYLADIAGHGLPASILMGRLKTAARTALLDSGRRDPEQTLPLLLDRLNTVLPQVKEPQMYATFTGFRLGVDGLIFYALAASPPVLHWHAGSQSLSQTTEPQLPLGLLPVDSFDGHALTAAPGDLLIVATDGILEVCDKKTEEFGIERLSNVIAANPHDPLPELAAKILASARQFGRQFDDQTILLVRCL